MNQETLDSHPKFMSKYYFDLLLMSDYTNKTIKTYNAYGDKGIISFDFDSPTKTYILDKYRKSIENVKSDGYETGALEFQKGVTT